MAFCDYKNDPKYKPLKKKIRKKRIICLTMYGVTIAAAVIFGYFWGKNTSYGTVEGAMLAAGLIALVAAPGPLGVFKIISDRYVEGEIIEIRTHAENMSDHLHRQMIKGARAATVVEIYVLKENGTTAMFRMKFEDKPPELYKVGDRVRHYPGHILFERENKAPGEKQICSHCGQYLDIEENDCPFCGMPLLK